MIKGGNNPCLCVFWMPFFLCYSSLDTCWHCQFGGGCLARHSCGSADGFATQNTPNRSKKMKDLLVILGVLAFVLIIPTMGWISSRLEAARNRKRDPKGELSRRD